MNELQTILAETCTRLFTDHATTAVLEGAEKGEWPAALWQALEENGLTLPQVPEARGGAGGSWNDAFVVLMAAGRFAAPVPLAAALLALSVDHVRRERMGQAGRARFVSTFRSEVVVDQIAAAYRQVAAPQRAGGA